ncbi:ESPR-type extended signal peptide-containing protein [Pasteurella sp. PK-2025]|uniref:ESPR-type extended signal peptide-containing protein n=1 Tax=Pasteurella sp. PK-2025 TaxID=3413133 RepID=UPI003C7658C2
MNKIFKVIWNHATQTWIAVSELTKSHGKTNSQTDKRQSPTTIFLGISITGALLFTMPALANANQEVSGGGKDKPCQFDHNNIACGNDGTKAGGARGNNGPKGNIAIGINTIAQSLSTGNVVSGNIAIGYNVSAIGNASLAIGVSTGNYGGSKTVAAASNSYAIGHGAVTGGTGRPGPDNGGRRAYDLDPEEAARTGKINALGAIAIGSEAWVLNPAMYGIAIGDNATAAEWNAMAYGRMAYAKAGRTLALGLETRAEGKGSLAIGAYTQTTGEHSIAIGASTQRSSAAKASGNASVSIGEDTNSSSDQAIAIGKKANSSGAQAIALGFESKATEEHSIAIGKGSKALATRSISLGSGAKVESSNAVALGNNITIASGFEHAVVLGTGSSTQNGTKETQATVNEITYSNFAGHDNVSKGHVVSVGNSTHRRQIVNLAPGNISATSTDAVNGSQLYMVADTVANLAKATATHLGGGSQLQGNNITAPSYTLYKGSETDNTAGNGNTKLTNAPFTNVGAALSGLNTYINTGFNITDNSNTKKGVVTPGDTVKFANGKNTTSNITQEANGVTTIAFDIVDTDLTVANGKVNTPTNGDGAKLVNATTVAKVVNDSFWKVGKAQDTNGITFNNTDDEVKAGDEVRFADGNFTKVSVGTKNEANNKTVTAIKVDVDAQKVVEAAQTPVVYTDKQGNKLIKKDNGKFVKADQAPNGAEIDPANVIASINSGSNSTTAPMTLANIQSNLAEDNNGTTAPDFNNVAQNKNNAATVGDVLNSGWNLQENGTEKDFVKHGDTVNFKNGRGVQVNITKATNGVNDVKFDTPLAYVPDTGNTNTESATPTNTVKFFGANNGGPVTLTNVNSGLGNQDLANAAASNPNNAVNVKDLHNAISGYSFTLGGANTDGEFEALTTSNDEDKKIKKDETFMLKAGKNIKIKQIENGYEIATKDQIQLGKNDPSGTDGSLNVTGKNGAGVNINGADGSLTLTGAQSNGHTPSLKITTEKGDPIINNTPAGGVNRIVYTDNGTKRQVATMDDGLTFAGDSGTASRRKLGETLTIKGGETNSGNLSNGNNIGVDSDGNGNLTVKLAKNITLGNNNANDGSIGGLANNLPVPAQNTKQEAPTANPDQHKAATVGDVLNAGFNVRGAKSAGGNVEDVDFVKPYDTIEFEKGEGTEVILSNADNKKTTVKVNVQTDNTTIKVDPTSKKLTAVTSNITGPTKVGEKITFNPETSTALVTAKTVADVANKLIEEGLNFAGNTANVEVKRPLGSKLTIKGGKADETDVSDKNIHVKADNNANELIINFSEKPEFKELKLVENGKAPITLNTTGDTNTPALSLTSGDKAVALKNVAPGATTLTGEHRGDKNLLDASTKFDNAPAELQPKLKKAYTGLADLNGSDATNAFTVADARNLGWVVSAQNNNYAEAVRNAHEVRFIGTNMATVTGKTTTEGVREITVDVNAQKVVESAQIPVVYTNAEGKKLVKSKNGKFYVEGTDLDENGAPTNPNNQAVEPENIMASMNSGSNATQNSPIALANVKSNLMSSDNQDSAPAFNQLFKNNAATVEDVLNSGWNLKNNNTAKDFVVHDDNIDFVDGNATSFVVTTEANKTSKIHVDVNTDGTTIKVGDNKKLEAVTSEINPTEGADGKPNFTPTTGSSLVTAETVSNVANKIVSEGLDFTGNNDTVNVHRDLGTKLTIKGEKENDTDVSGKNIYVTADDTNKALVIKFSEKPEFKELKLAEPNKSSITLNTTGDTNNPALTLNGGQNNSPVALKNVASGLGNQTIEDAAKNNGNNAVNVSDLNTALQAYKFKLGGEKTEGEFEALSATATDEDKQIKKDETFMLKAGKNIKIKQVPKGYEIATKDQIELGKNAPDGTNGSLNVTGKSGAGVKIDGADGSLTLTGAPNNGQAPSLKITSKKGNKTLDAADPADGINRITYTTDNGKERQVATMDDGLTFAGDFGADAPRKLGEKLTIKGGETDTNKLSNGNNIGVESNANGTLTVKLAKKLNLGDPNDANNGEVGGLAHNLDQPVDTANKQEGPKAGVNKHNAATVGDVLNAGFNVRGAKTAEGQVDDVDFVKPYDTVEFVDGNATDLIVTNTDNKKTTVTVNIRTDDQTIQVDPNSKKITAVTSNITNSVTQTGDKTTFTPDTPTALVTAKTVADVANKLIEEGLVFAGNTANTDIKRPLGTKLTIKGEKADDTEVSAKNIYVKADNANGKNELVINFSEKPEFKELKLAEPNKSSITLNTTGDTTNPALTLKGDGDKAVALKNVAAGTTTLDGTHRGDKVNGQNPTEISTATPLGDNLSKAYKGLADLVNVEGTNAFTVADAKNLGWIVSAPGNDYAKDVRNANEVRFIGTNMATVTGKTSAEGVREITVDVNAQKVVETAQIPVVYTDKTGKKLIKSPNGKFYAEGTKLNDQGEPENPANPEVPAENVIASLNDAKGSTTDPTTLANVKSNLADGDNQTSAPESVQLNKNNAATVGDVLNSGWDLQENGTAKDFVKHGDKVNFINGRGTKVTIGTANGANTIKFDTPLAYVPDDASSNDESTPTNKVKLVGKDNNSPVTLANIASGLGGKSLSEAANATPNNAVNVSDLNQAIDDFNFKLGGKASTDGEFTALDKQDCEDGCIKKDETFVLDAGKNIKIKQIANGYEVATKDQMTLGSKTANNQEGVDGNLTVTGKEGASVAIDGKDGSITLTGKADNGHTPTVKMGTEKGKSTVDNTDPTDGIDRIVYETKNADGTAKKRQVATMDDGLVFAGDSGTDSPRKLGEKLTIKGGETQTDKLSNNNNIGVVSDGAGNLTIKLAKNLNLSEPNDANNGKISGLGHNLPVPANNANNQDAPTAEDITAKQHNAATVGDVLNAGWNLKNNGASKDFVKPYDTVNFVDGANAQLVVTPNAEGTSSDVTVNVVGLPVQYTTKDGIPVVKVGNKYYKVDANGKPITKKDDGSDAEEIPVADLITNIVKPGTAPNVKSEATTLGNVVSALKPYSETTPTTLNTSKGNLLDLNTKDADGNTPISEHNVVTVGDLRKMGWVVSADKTTGNLNTAYNQAVMNAHEVKFVGTGVATVSGKTEGETHTITVDVNAQDVINKAHLPVVYTKSDGKKVVKDPLDGKFYEVNDQGEPDKAKEVQPNEIIASINNPSNDKNTAGKPTTLTNLKGNLNRVNKEGKVTKPDGSPLDPATANDLTKAPTLPDAFNEEHNDYKPTILNNAATIGDVLNAGWNLQGNGKAVDFVKPFDTVNFADGIGTTVDVKASEDGKTNTIKVNTVMAYTDANGNLLKKANDGKYYLPDQVNADGTTKDTAVAVDNPQVNLVNAKDNNTTTPTRLGNVAGGTNTYADKAATADGQPLVKVGDKYYAPDQFTAGKLNTNAVETPLENGVEPTSNVTKAKSGLADLEHSDPNNVMTVSDAKNMGWIVSADGNDYAKDVRNANEVKFIGGTGISVTGETKDNTREITIAIKEGEVVPSNEYTAEDGKTLIKVGEDFYYKDDIDPTTGKAKPGKNKVSDEIASKAINNGTGFVTGNKVADAIKKSNWTLGKANPDEIAKTAFKFDAGNVENINPNDNVRFSDGKNTRVALGTVESLDPEGNKITTTTVKFDVDSPIDFKYTDADGKEYVKANNGKFYAKEDVNADGSLKTVAEGAPQPTALEDTEVAKLHKGAQLINGLGKDGQANSPYEMQDKIAKGLDDYRKQNQNATPEQIAAETDRLVQANPTQKDTFVKGTGGVNLDNVSWAEKPDQAVNKDQLDQTVNKSGFLVKQNGTSTLTDDANKGSTEDGKTEKVTPNDVVDFVNGTNTSVTATTTRENGRDVTKVRVDVTGMPVTYTDKEGNKVAKAPDGKYYKVDKDTGLPKVEEGADIPADKLVASMVNPDGDSTTKPTTLSNIANGASTFEAPKGEGDKALKLANDGKWYEADKVEANGQAKADAQPVTKPKNVGTGGLVDFAKSNPNNAASVGDLQHLGWVVSASQTEGGYTDQVRNTNKVDFVGEGLAKVTGLTREDGTREIKVSVQTGEVIGTNSEEPVLKGENGTEIPVIKIGDKYYKKSDLDQNTGLPTKEAKPLTTEELANVVNKQNKGAGLVTGNQVGDAIQNSGWNVGKATSEEVNKTTFNNNDGKAEKVNPNDNVRFSDGKNTVASLGTVKVVDEHGVITTTTTVKVDVDSPIDFKYTDPTTGKEYVKANDGQFYAKEAVNPDGSLKPVANGATPPTALAKDAIAKLTKGAQLTNGSQADGVNNEAYKVVDPIQAAIQQAISEKLKANPNAPAEEIAKAIDTARAEAVKMHPNAKDNIKQGTGGVTLNNVGWATQPDQAVNKDQLDQTVNKAGFLVKQNGGSTIAGQDTEKVTPNDVVNFINGGNTVAKAETTRDPATGQDRTDVSIHMTGLPLTYTAKDGTPVTKVGDQYFKVNANGYPIGEAIPASELTTNLVNPTAKANEIGAPTVLGNVASGTNTIANKVSADGKPLIQVGQGANAKYYTPDQFEQGVLKANATEAVNPVEATQPMDKARGGLADLAHSHPNNALSVSDASKLGFVVGAKDNQYAADVRNAHAVEFVSGNDIAKVTGETRADGVREIKVTVSKNPVFESVQVGGAQGPRIGSSKDGNIRIAKADGSPSRLTNVAPGIEATDAVNVGQLNAKIGDVHKRINKLDKGMRAGVAGATAVAFLQRPNEAGKSLVSLGVGNFKGQSAVAVGYSRNSDNNKISIKLGSGFNTNGDVNIGGSIGYQW